MKSTTTANTWNFAPNSITVNGQTFPASYSLARGGDVYVFTALRAAADAPEMPVRVHISADMPMHAEAVAAAQAAKDKPSAQDKPAPVQAAPAPVDKPAPAKKASAPAKAKPAAEDKSAPAKKASAPAKAKPAAEDKSAPAKRSHKSKGIRRPDVPAQPVQDKPSAPAKKPAPVQAAPAPVQDKPAAVPTDKPWIGTTITGKGWNIAFDQQAGRTRVLFQAQPTDAQKAAIENAGFYWSAQLNSWNKKLTCKAYRAAQALAVALNALA